MVLESTIVCVDNSEFSRNGDFPPSRFSAQVDSINMLCSAKMQSNAESSVGLMTLAGRSATILVTSTRDPGRIFSCLHDVRFEGMADFVGGIQKAQLALKHRQNTLQRQRIVVFVSSPIDVETDLLVRLGKGLKKNNVSVDVVNVGVEGDNLAKIDAFVEAVNSNNNSRALHVEAGTRNLTDALMQSEIYAERDGNAVGSGDGGGAGGFGGDFPDAGADPELAMALRISMEEEQARQAAAAARETGASDGTGEASGEGQGKAENESGAKFDDDNDDDLYGTGTSAMDVDGDEDDDELMQRALALSRAEQGGPSEKEEDKS